MIITTNISGNTKISESGKRLFLNSPIDICEIINAQIKTTPIAAYLQISRSISSFKSINESKDSSAETEITDDTVIFNYVSYK
ncbi:MAG: hypothetical protein LUG95_08320 [Clostridiales bacterium]|nr:hypothetical protein [Clostridiales bacterium]